MEKKDIRKKFLTMRESLSKEEVQNKSEIICKQLLKMSCFEYTDWIYGYMSIRNETDVRPFLQHHLNEGKNIALPKISGDTMEFYQIKSFEEDLEEGSFHILEPKEGCPKVEKGGFILVPGVAFDREGGRIGYGKGYYDRYFSTHSQALEKIGIAYKFQVIETVPITSTDVRLNGLVYDDDLWMFV